MGGQATELQWREASGVGRVGRALAYISETTLRFSFIVGVSSPFATLKSFATKTNFCTFCALETASLLAAASPSSMYFLNSADAIASSTVVASVTLAAAPSSSLVKLRPSGVGL